MEKQLEPFPMDVPQTPSTAVRPNHRASQKKKRVMIMVLIAIVVCMGIASGVGFWLIKHHHTTIRTTNQGTTDTQQTSVSTTPAVSTTQQYTSNGTDLNLSFIYPTNWSVMPASGNNTTDQPITITSPISSISTTTGTVSGEAVVTIRPGTAQVSELASGNALVAQASAQFAYSTPTSSQHQYPYLTFVHLAGGQNPTNAFDEVIITGITSFSAGQSLTSSSLGQLDPIISARFYACASGSCTGSNATPLTVTNEVWQNTTLFQQVQSIFTSLQLH